MIPLEQHFRPFHGLFSNALAILLKNIGVTYHFLSPSFSPFTEMIHNHQMSFSSEMRLEPIRTSTMKLFCENN